MKKYLLTSAFSYIRNEGKFQVPFKFVLRRGISRNIMPCNGGTSAFVSFCDVYWTQSHRMMRPDVWFLKQWLARREFFNGEQNEYPHEKRSFPTVWNFEPTDSTRFMPNYDHSFVPCKTHFQNFTRLGHLQGRRASHSPRCWGQHQVSHCYRQGTPRWAHQELASS